MPKRPEFADLTIRGTTFYLYGWSRDRELSAAAQALWLPEELLHLGTHLYEGFPENDESMRAEIEHMMDLLRAFAVGRDLSRAPAEIGLQILENELGIADFINSPKLESLRADVAMVLNTLGHQSDELRALADRASEIERAIGDQIPSQYGTQGKVQDDVYEGYRAAQTMVCVTQLSDDPKALYRAAERSVFGAFGCNVREPGIRMQWLRSIFDAAIGAQTDGVH